MSRITRKRLIAILLIVGVSLVVGGIFLPVTVAAAVISVGGVIIGGAIYFMKGLVTPNNSPITSEMERPRPPRIRIPTDEEREMIFAKYKQEVPPTPNIQKGYKTPPIIEVIPKICPPAPSHKEITANPDRPRSF